MPSRDRVYSIGLTGAMFICRVRGLYSLMKPTKIPFRVAAVPTILEKARQ